MLNIIIFTIILFLQFESGTTQDVKCLSLTFDGIITCEQQGTNNKNNDCSDGQPVGTVAKYTCKPFYVLRDSDSLTNRMRKGNLEMSEGELKCGKDGRWIGHAKFKLALCQEDCGRRLTNPKPLIINGVATSATNWPWHVALFRPTMNSGIDYICGGTIISRSTILTVAHCVTNHNGEKLLPNSTLVVIGAVSSNFGDNFGRIETQIITVKNIYVSENYNVRKDFQADIAILHLSRNIEYTKYVSPICLPNDFTVDTNAIAPRTLSDVVGFGVDETGEISQSLKHGTLEIKSHTECFITLERILSESQFCAGSPREGHRVTVCNGDSGGGLFRPSVIDQKYYVHGLVSTGEPSRKEGPCQTHAVFTRVYSFIIFIRDILNEIKDNAVLTLASDTAYPYTQAGSEEERVRFLTITQEWNNKVTAIELSYVDIDPEVLFQSLEFSKTVQSINFTNVKFTQLIPTRRPQIFPLLKTFYLDVLIEDFGRFTNERKFPLTLSKEYLRSYLFFEKAIDGISGNSDIVERIATLRTNIDLTIHIFKLLKINHEEGKIVLSQIPFSNQILDNLPSDFQLKHLALSRTPANFSSLYNKARKLEILVLDEVNGFQSQDDWSQAFQIWRSLKEFVFIRPRSYAPTTQIFASDMPKSLKHLALTNIQLLLDSSGNSSRSFTFTRQQTEPFRQSTQVRLSRSVLPENGTNDLDTFFCETCLQNENISIWIKQLSNVYPKLKKLVLKLEHNVDVPITTTTFEQFRNLKFAIINLSGSVQFYNKRNGTWYVKPLSLKYSHGFSHLDYVFNRKDNFWSSEADYIVGNRLRSYERNGYKTGHYRFNGGYEARRRITTIPKGLQSKLHTVDIVNTAISKQTFLESLESAAELKILRLINVSFTDYFVGDLHFPNLIEYRFDVPIWPVLNYFSLERITNIVTLLFRTNFLFKERQPDFDIKVNFLSSKVKKYHISYATCVLLSWDAIEGSLISQIKYTSVWLKNIKENPVRKLSFEYWDLDSTSVPTTISHLNLNFVIVRNMGLILRRLSGLKNLKLINVRVNDEGNGKDWDWIEIDMEDLSKQSEALEYLALEKAHLRNYNPGMKFEKVEFVYLESCTFEKSFVRNFMSTFPNLKRLVILGGKDPRLQIYLDVIILGALRSQTVEWILMSQYVGGSSPNRARKEINIIFDKIGINGKDPKYLILERASNTETWTHNSSLGESLLESELLEMKGVTDFGTYSQCHATTYKQGGWRGFVEDLFGGILDIPKLRV